MQKLQDWLDDNNGSTKAIYVEKLRRLYNRIYRKARRTAGNVIRKIYPSFHVHKAAPDFIPPVLNNNDMRNINNAFKIIFCGDLILLEDQVKRAWNEHEYNFNSMFEFTSKYFSSADLSIGVLEGPLAGSEAGYSTSNYDDGKKLALNFPDTFAQSIKRAGFDLVTTANNHLLDKGFDGAMRTLDVLDKIGLDYTGSYRSQEEKEAKCIKLIEKDGLKFAILSYTYGCNGYTENELVDSHITSLIVPPSSKNFSRVKARVYHDFERAKSFNPDFIIVLPHMGTQFLRKPDYYQREWVRIFKDFGADIILSDHTHSVQPVEISGNIFTAYCPGNYANVYREFNGDANILVEIYIDRVSKKIIYGSVIPMWTCSYIDGNYRPVPLSEIENSGLRLTTHDLSRAVEINDVITSTIFGRSFKFDMVRERYYLDESGFRRELVRPLQNVDVNNKFLELVNSCKSICFLGDSVTQGTKNSGVPWYEPLLQYIKPEVHNYSYGGGTVKTMIEHAGEISKVNSDMYIIAIGTNDVRYCDKNLCAMTPDEYIAELRELEKLIDHDNSRFVYIAPWYSIDGDPFCPLSYEDKLAKNELYSSALEKYCQSEGRMFINANNVICDAIMHKPAGYYLLDHIHPNTKRGVYLYSQAVIS